MAHSPVRLIATAVAAALLPQLASAHPALNLEQLDSIDTGGAEISAYDPGSRRLFTTSAAGRSVAIVDASRPERLVRAGTIDVSVWGSPNSVAAQHGFIAVAIGAEDKTQPGRVAFYNTRGQLQGSVQVGALPDMLTFTPDGRFLLVANEGEPSGYGAGYADPEGSISIIDVPHGRWKTPAVRTVRFTAYNGKEAALRAQGIRIYGPGANAARDFEPEYVTVTDDSRHAYVTLQENNAVAKIDIARGSIVSLLPLGYKDWNRQPYTAATFEWSAQQLPAIGTTPAGQQLRLGGFSGLFYEGLTDKGELKLIANTDRGPNGEPDGVLRPFLLPQFTPRLVRFTLDPASGRLTLVQQILLRDNRGRPLTGLPNTAVAGGTAGTPHNDEVPLNVQGQVLGLDALGGDFEGIAVDEDGSFWLPDEYRPAIYHFGPQGVLLQRYIPVGAHAAAGLPVPAPGAAGALGIEALPSVLANRRQNRGMEAIALRNGKVYGFVQSPARNPSTLANGALNNMKNVRVVELDPATLATRQFIYIMDNPVSTGGADTIADKIGDAAATPEGFLVVERDDDNVPADDAAAITKKVYSFALGDATDVTGLDDLRHNGKSIDQMTAVELAAVNLKPIAKTLDVDLVKAGYAGVQKVEGLALLDDGRIAVVNDNDFQVAGSTLEKIGGAFTGRFVLPDGYVPEVTIIGLIERPGLDASDKDKLISIRPWPVLGMYEPDAISNYRVRGRSYFVTVNEGDAREWPQPGAEDDTYAEESRVKDLALDAAAFPNAADLQKDRNLGRLNVTTTLGDIDGDGDYDQLYTLGGRSFTIWDGATGQLVFDSGSQLERITAAALPEVFNAGHEEGDVTFDNRSDNKGPEPEALALGQIDGRSYAFVGLERVGGIAAWDITDPQAPVFLDYVNSRTFANDGKEGGDVGPEGLLFIPAHESPNRQPLLVVTSEISGNVSTYSLDTGRPWKRRFGWWSWWKPRHAHR